MAIKSRKINYVNEKKETKRIVLAFFKVKSLAFYKNLHKAIFYLKEFDGT